MVGQFQGPTPNNMPSSVPTQHFLAVVGPGTTSPEATVLHFLAGVGPGTTSPAQ